MRVIYFILILVFMSGCSSKNQLFDASARSSISHKSYSKSIAISNFHAQQSVYTIAPHDRLSILFYKYPELSTTTKNSFQDDLGVEVSDDGYINMPLIKRVRVAGLTKHQVQNLLYSKYSKYLTDPALKVEILNQRVYVLGEVKNPGALNLNKYRVITPIKAIAQRGGLTDFANIHAVKILRGDRKNYKLINIDLSNINSLRANNITLAANDIVYIPHSKAKDFNMPINGIAPSLNIINTILNSISVLK